VILPVTFKLGKLLLILVTAASTFVLLVVGSNENATPPLLLNKPSSCCALFNIFALPDPIYKPGVLLTETLAI
jgi:hypothetical protein